MNTPPVSFLRRKDLDLAAWDRAVTLNPYAAPYGLSWWLEAVTDGHWYGAVLEDYRAVLPVPLSPALLRRTARLVNGAAFTQHSGPFGIFNPSETAMLLDAIPKRWLLRKLALSTVDAPATARDLTVTTRTNYVLALNRPYPTIAARYRADLRRKLRDLPPAQPKEMGRDDFFTFYQQHTGDRFGMRAREYAAQKRLLDTDANNGTGRVLRLTDTDGQTLAAIFLARQGKRLVNLMASSSLSGLKANAMARLLDAIIRAYAKQDLILDFEGSDIPGVATFFSGFGAEKTDYLSLSDQPLMATILP